jgi:hypothetical protein
MGRDWGEGREMARDMVEGERRKEYNSHNHDITENVREIEKQARKHSKVRTPITVSNSCRHFIHSFYGPIPS